MAMTRILPDPNEVVPFMAEAALAEGVAVISGTDANECALSTATPPTSGLLGITRTSAAINTVVDVVMGGIARAKTGGVVTKGNNLTTDGTGRVIAATPGSGVNAQLIGVALETSGGADEYIAVKVDVGMMQGQ